MPSRNGALKQARIAIRLCPQDQERIERAIKDKGYANVSTFIRAAVNNEMGRRTELLDAEQRIAASFDRLSRDVFRVARGQQALFALVDALTKTILTCMPEPASEVRAASVAIAKARYDRLIKSAGRSMVGDARAAMLDLIDNSGSEQ